MIDKSTPESAIRDLHTIGRDIERQYRTLADPTWYDGSEAQEWVRLAQWLQSYKPRTTTGGTECKRSKMS